MNLPAIILGTGGSFLFLCLVFHPLERSFPAKQGQRFFRPEWWVDLCFFLGQYLLWSGLVLWLLSSFADRLDGGVPAGFREAIAGQPWWLQAVEVILLSDFCVYWGHRLQHRVPFLWRFHSIHHSAEHLDWLAAHREHPLDTVYPKKENGRVRWAPLSEAFDGGSGGWQRERFSPAEQECGLVWQAGEPFSTQPSTQ